jgi:hypothetical protein
MQIASSVRRSSRVPTKAIRPKRQNAPTLNRRGKKQAEVAGEGERDKPRGTEAVPARRLKQPRNRKPRIAWRKTAATATRRLRSAQGARKMRSSLTAFRAGMKAITSQPALPRRVSLERAARTSFRPIMPARPAIIETVPDEQRAADIQIAVDDEVSAIQQDFARRLAGARNGSERRAIKNQRKSAIAQARQKAKLWRAARVASQRAARQNMPRKQHRHKPRR